MTEIAPLLRAKGYKDDVLIFDGEETILKIIKDSGIRIISFGTKNFLYNPLFIGKLTEANHSAIIIG